jgi:hypothetical protein
MAPQFATGTLVEYAGLRWCVQRALGVEAVLLHSDAGEEALSDPLKTRLAEDSAPIRPMLFRDRWGGRPQRHRCAMMRVV